MHNLNGSYFKTNDQADRLKLADELNVLFSIRAAKHDEEATFPFDNFDNLKENGFTHLTVPKKYGGKELSLYEFLQIQERIAQGDAATALSLGWHLGIIMNVRETNKWPQDLFEKVCKEIITENKLINSAATEPRSGSPARGGKPETTAELINNRWVLNGKKTYASLAPALDYFIITATIIDSGEVGEFLVPKSAGGLKIEETWDTLGMRATRSDDLILTKVTVEKEALIGTREKAGKPKPQGWLLHIPACYVGVAIAARNEAIQFSKDYQPNSADHPICEFPEVQQKIALMEIELMTTRQFMYSTAERWDQANKEERERMGTDLAAVKYVATNSSVKVVDLAMRIVGGHSLFKSSPMQRYYRDVRAGLHNPPADEMTLKVLAKRALES